MKERTYDIVNGTHGTAMEEWAPHKALAPDFFEWHYITCPMTGTNGHQYFLFLCNFNFSSDIYKQVATDNHPEMVPEGMKLYSVMAHMCDYTDDLFLSGGGPVIAPAESVYDEETNTLLLANPKSGIDINFRYEGKEVYLHAKTDIYECELHCTGGDQVMWMQDKLGINGFIREGAEKDRSFYYSLPKLPYRGWLRYKNKAGKEIYTEVCGQGWIDRQWGNYLTKSWEWTSFRFADGDRVNTYNFAGGYQVCTYQHNDGSCEHFDSFKVVQNGYARSSDNVWFSWGWDYTLPLKEKQYTLIPLSRKNYVPTPGNTIFEGLSRIINPDGEQVGWAVTESMDVRVMQNAPYQEFNCFPE